MGGPAPVRVSGPARSCGNARRRVFPCRLLRRPRRVLRHLARQPSARAAPRAALFRHGGVPPPARCVAPRLFTATPVPRLRVSAPCGFPGRWWSAPIRALPRTWRTVPCDASTAYAAALRHGTCRHRGVTPSRRALPSRQRRTWRPIDAGHSSTPSPRQHQLSSYRNACRHWPECWFSAPSLPELRRRPEGAAGGSDGVQGRAKRCGIRDVAAAGSASPRFVTVTTAAGSVADLPANVLRMYHPAIIVAVSTATQPGKKGKPVCSTSDSNSIG